jgi:hypothetical protein
MMAHKDAVVKSNVEGVAFLMKKNKIDVFIGTGKVLGEGKVSVTGDDGKERRSSRRMSSSPPAPMLPAFQASKSSIDEKVIVSSTGAMDSFEGSGPSDRGRRRRDRAGTRLGVEAARRQGDRGRVSRHDPRAAWTATSPSSSSGFSRSRAWSSISAPR